MNRKKLWSLFLVGLVMIMTIVSARTVTLSLLQQDISPYNQEDVELYEMYVREFSKATGIQLKLNLVPIPAGNYGEKVALLLAGGTYPDIIWWRDDAELPYVDQGLLMDLSSMVFQSEVMDKAMPEWNKARLENYPYILWISPLQTRLAVTRKEWLDEFGRVPVTTDDYYDLLKFYKENKSKYGITITGDLSRLDWIFDAAFGVSQMWIQKEDGTWEFGKVSQGEKEKLAFYAKLYREGLLDPEFVTTGWQGMEDKFYTGEVGMLVATAGIVLDLYQQRFWDRGVETELVPLPPPLGPSGKAGFTALNLNKEGRGFSITTTCKDPDVAFQLLEFMASDYGQYLDRLGLEGREYNIVNGEIVLTDRGKGWWPRFFEVPSWEAPIEMYGRVGTAALDIVHSIFEADNYYVMPQQYATMRDEMNTIYKEYAVKIVTNQWPIEKFDEMVQLWKRAGGDLFTRLANDHFSRAK